MKLLRSIASSFIGVLHRCLGLLGRDIGEPAAGLALRYQLSNAMEGCWPERSYLRVEPGKTGPEVSKGKKVSPRKGFAYSTFGCAQGDQPVRCQD